MNYYIADLHLFHRNVTNSGRSNFDSRPFDTVWEMHGEIVERWNKRVRPKDTVYVLGDLSLRKNYGQDVMNIVHSLSGRKVLIKGNHDCLKDDEYLEAFEEVCYYKELTDAANGKPVKLVLSHYPILMWKGQHKGTVLLYGHVHNSAEYDYFKECVNKMNDDNFKAKIENSQPIRAYNVGCMMPYMDYTPRALSDILKS